MTATVVAPAAMPGDRRRGAALPIVLLFAALLAGLAASAMRASLSGVRAAAAFAEATRADELGRGAGDALAYFIATHDAAARRGGRLALNLPGATVDVEYRSESARIDANLAPLGLVTALLVAAGAEPAEAAEAADRARLFRERAARKTSGVLTASTAAATPGAEQGLPTGGPPSFAGFPAAPGSPAAAPPGAAAAPKPLAIRDTSEVVRAWGLSEALARRVLPSLTVSNGTAQVDPILAGKLVLTALLGADERVDDYMSRRANGFVTEASALQLLPIPSQTFAGFRDSAAVRAVARVALPHGFVRRYEVVVAPPRSPGGASVDASPNAVPVIVSWRRLP